MSDYTEPIQPINVETGRQMSNDAEKIGTETGSGSNTVRDIIRRRYQIGGATLAAVAGVTNTTPASDAYALVVRTVGASASGTEYTEGDIDTTITGTAIMWEDASDTLRAVSAVKPLPVSGTLTHNNAAPAATNLGVLSVLINAATPTFTEAMLTTFSGDTSGRLRVQGTGATGSAVPGVAVYNGVLNSAGNLEGVRGASATLNTTTGILAAGLVAVFDDTSPTSITENQFGSLRMSTNRSLYGTIRDAAGNERGANVSASGELSAIPSASASGTGLSVSKTDALVATAVAVKAGSGRVYGYHIFNSNTSDAYVHFYDIASASVTVGTSARTRSLWIPSGGAIDTVFTVPLTFATAITVAATTTITGSTAPATGLLVNIDYI